MWFIIIFWWGSYAGQMTELSQKFTSKETCEKVSSQINEKRPSDGRFHVVCIQR
jgi:hypothetical protein